MWQLTGLIAVVSYLIGSIPWGFIAATLRGVDIRKHGSGNIGATNVFRVLGRNCGTTVFVLDAAKGFAAVRVAISTASHYHGSEGLMEYYAVLGAALCVVGHSFPLWLRFKGGKGVATSAGALFGVVPFAASTIFIVWVVVFYATRYVSVASISAALMLPVAVAGLIWLRITNSLLLLYFSTGMTALVVWRHRANISRLFAGTEPRFTRK